LIESTFENDRKEPGRERTRDSYRFLQFSGTKIKQTNKKTKIRNSQSTKPSSTLRLKMNLRLYYVKINQQKAIRWWH
jgi:hypothetical protein